MNKAVILLPAKNEADSIGGLIDEIKTLKLDLAMVVVDGISSDGTRAIALEQGAEVIVGSSEGKGSSVKIALEKLTSYSVIMLDADGTYPPEYIPEVIEKLRTHYVVYCPRVRKDKGAMSLIHRIGNWGLTALANLLYAEKTKDLCTGMWGFRGEIVGDLASALVSKGFALEAELFTYFAKKGYNIGEVPIHYRKRVGKSKSKLKPWDALKIAWFLIRRRFS